MALRLKKGKKKKGRKGPKIDRNKPKLSEAEARVMQEIATGTLVGMDQEIFKIFLPNPAKYDVIHMIVKPPKGDEDQNSYYSGAEYCFVIEIKKGTGGTGYPFREPEISMLPGYKIYHPNISWDLKVCLNLRKGKWTANKGLKYVAYAILHVLLNPNMNDPQEGPLPKSIAEQMRTEHATFVKNVARSQKGESISCQIKDKSGNVSTQSFKFPTVRALKDLSAKALQGNTGSGKVCHLNVGGSK